MIEVNSVAHPTNTSLIPEKAPLTLPWEKHPPEKTTLTYLLSFHSDYAAEQNVLGIGNPIVPGPILEENPSWGR